AHYLSAMGAEVMIVQRSAHVLRGVDPDLAIEVEEAFRERGVQVFTGTQLAEVRREGGGVRVRFFHQGRAIVLRAEAVFDGLGRQPALGGLGLEKAGVHARRPLTDPAQRTNIPHIFAAGDCAGQHEIVHVAIQQGELAARNAARQLQGSNDLEKMDYRLKLFVVFTEPQVAVVGQSEEELRAAGHPFLAARYPFDDHGKSLVMGETRGFVKLLADPDSREILGGAVVGPHAADLIHEIVVAMGFRATASQLAALPHYHPTLSEIWTYPAEELAG
ncbi:MAG: FAD-dependent oxidoreductase, partial [Terrimicrobiaceae bacterium]|nr:FAD-dependent oxidoreductase [Terrimicrobiaceae bacterium]